MSIPPEERRKIYEEEKARIESERNAGQNEMTLTSLKPNTAALLSYLGGWITGIIFLVLEQKNRFVRFNAAQSIIVFGFLNAVSLMFHQIPYAGVFAGIILGVFGLILWIVLMVKASQGELYVVPGAGELARKLLGDGPEIAAVRPVSPSVAPASVPAAAAATTTTRSPHLHSVAGRAGRITGSAFAIAWSIALLVFLNFFSDYVAYYHLEQVGSQSVWFREPFLTADFSTWLPIVNVVLAFTVVGHMVLLAIDKYVVRETLLLALDLFSITSTAALLLIFPFDFNVFGSRLAWPLDLSVHMTLAFIILGLAIGALVRFIKIMVNLIRGTATY
jgi:uncharacterized membrane protein